MRILGNLFSRLVAFVWFFIPWRLNLLFAQLLAFVWLDLFGIRKKVIYDNLKIAFPQITDDECKRIAKKSMVALCRSFFDLFKVPSLTPQWIEKNVVFEGQSAIEEIKTRKEGFFFLCLHIGSGDLAGAIVSESIKPVTVISKRFSNAFMDAFWFGLRERSQSQFINAHGKNNAFEILASLKKNRGVVFVLDQFMGLPYGVETKFFGVTTGTAYGLALFAKKTKKPIYPLYTYWDDAGKVHICIDPVVDLTEELSENYEVITNKLNSVLEKIITKYPEHWMWVHRRWKKFE